MSKIALVRHGQSEWNQKGFWTGWQDSPLSKKGEEEAKKAATILKDISFHLTFSSDLKRAYDTLEIIKKELKIQITPTISHQALKERHYGEYTGKNKWEIQKKVGEKRFKEIRRGWNYPIKDGETLKDVYDRVVPYFLKTILPHLTAGKDILIVAHGNSIMALIKHLERISDVDISEIELKTGEVIIYDIDLKGKIVKKERRNNEKN